MGKWYEVEKYFAIFELGGTCITARYTDFGNGTVEVLNTQIQTG
jgi:lipocalin